MTFTNPSTFGSRNPLRMARQRGQGRSIGPAGEHGKSASRLAESGVEPGAAPGNGAVEDGFASHWERSTGVARTADSRPAPHPSGRTLSTSVQSVRRGRNRKRSVPRLRTFAFATAHPCGLSALRDTDRHRFRSRPCIVRACIFSLLGVHRPASFVRSRGRTLELRPSAQQPRPPDEVLAGRGRGRGARATPREGALRSRGAHRPRCGYRASSLATTPPFARIQPRRRARGHRAARAGAAASEEVAHRPAPFAAAGESRKPGRTLRQRRGRIHRPPMACRGEKGCDRRRRADDRGHRVRALRSAPGSGSRMDRSLVLRPHASLLKLRPADDGTDPARGRIAPRRRNGSASGTPLRSGTPPSHGRPFGGPGEGAGVPMRSRPAVAFVRRAVSAILPAARWCRYRHPPQQSGLDRGGHTT